MERREFIEGVAALTATRWDAEGHDPENIEEWAPTEPGTYTTGEFSPVYLSTSGSVPGGEWLLEDSDFTERSIQVFYDQRKVNLGVSGEGEGIDGGLLAELNPDQARELGAALYQAAEELERRPGPGPEDGGADA